MKLIIVINSIAVLLLLTKPLICQVGNIGFEQGNTNTWTLSQCENLNSNSVTTGSCVTAVSNDFEVLSSISDVNFPGISNSPLGGNCLKIGDISSGGYTYKAVLNFSVSAAQSQFCFSYATVFYSQIDSSQYLPFFEVNLKDAGGNIIYCYHIHDTTPTAIDYNGNQNNYMNSGNFVTKNWKTYTTDLSLYIGTPVTIEFIVGGGKGTQTPISGYAYVDAKYGNMPFTYDNASISSGSNNSFCSNSNKQLCAPGGFNYLWTGNGVNSYTTQCINIPGAGTYSVNLSQPNTCSTVDSWFNFVDAPTSTISVSTQTIACSNCVSLLATETGTAYGIPLYYWEISNWTSTQYNPSVCTPGNYIYTLTVTNTANCKTTLTGSVAVVSSNFTAVLNQTINPESCPGLSDGSIQTSVSPSGNYTYTWKDNNQNVISNSSDIYNLPPNNYFLSVDDGISCQTFTYIVSSSIGSNCGVIRGHVSLDNNYNCTNDNGEQSLSGITLQANPGQYIGVTDYNGNYNIYVPFGSYTLSQLNFNNPNIFPSCTSSIVVTTSSTSPVSNNNDFLDTIPVNALDGQVKTIHSYGIVPGFSGSYYILLDKGTLSNDYTGVLKFVKPSVLNYISSTPNPLNIDGDTIYFSVNTFTNSNYQFIVNYQTPTGLPLGQSLQACAYLQINGNDTYLSNNTFCYTKNVSGSFDPNAKEVFPKGNGPQGYISPNDSILVYTIQFQNTGTDVAHRILIIDSISTKLNMNSIEVIGSSHSYSIQALPNYTLRFLFSNIMLPDSNTNEPASHGWIQYRIKQSATNIPGDEIKNTAYIYFDFNTPVTTNTTLHTLYSLPTGIEENKSDYFQVFPNPNHGQMSLTYQIKQASEFIITDVMGREVFKQTLLPQDHILNINSNLNSGLYLYSVLQNGEYVKVGKILVTK